MSYRYPTRNNLGAVKQEHTLIAEKTLGKPLPKGAEIHHVNGNKHDNRPENLVICPDHTYHMLLHRRAKMIAEGYPADYMKCRFCKQVDAPENLRLYTCHTPDNYKSVKAEHVICRSIDNEKQYQRSKCKQKYFPSQESPNGRLA